MTTIWTQEDRTTGKLSWCSLFSTQSSEPLPLGIKRPVGDTVAWDRIRAFSMELQTGNLTAPGRLAHQVDKGNSRLHTRTF